MSFQLQIFQLVLDRDFYGRLIEDRSHWACSNLTDRIRTRLLFQRHWRHTPDIALPSELIQPHKL